MKTELENLVERADKFGEMAHGSINQTRKYTGEPYIVHPRRVSQIAFDATGNYILAAALKIHDVFEDVTPVNPKFDVAYARAFIENDKVITIALELTDVYSKHHFPGLNRAQRHEKEYKRLSLISNDGQTGKVCDLIDNTDSIVEHDPNFARLYLKEKAALMPLLVRADEGLWLRAMQQLEDGLRKLG